MTATVDHPALSAVAAALEDAAALLLVDPSSLELLSVDAREWPDSCLDLPRTGEACADALTQGYLVRLSHGMTYHADLRGEVRRDAAAHLPADAELYLTCSLEDGTGAVETYRTDSLRLRRAEDAHLRRLLEEADFFAADAGTAGPLPQDGRRMRLNVILSRAVHHEVVRGDGVEAADDTEAFSALLAWVREQLPRMSVLG